MTNVKVAPSSHVTSQEGAYLAELLLDEGYEVVGISRAAANARRAGLRDQVVDAQVSVVSMAPNDFRGVLQTVISVAPAEIYSLAGQPSVGLSFDQPVESIERIFIDVVNLLEAIRFVDTGEAISTN
jgi:GDPmannose 4,6-dehydratase